MKFFVMYEYYLLESNPKKSLYDELVNLLDGSDANVIIADIKKFCNFYKDDIYNKEDKMIYSFWYLRWSIYWRTILVTALHTGYQDYNDLSKALLRYYYLNWIAGNTLTRIKQMSFNLIKWIKDKSDINFIKEQLENNLESNNAINRAIESLNGDIYYEQWSKPLFFMIEYKQADSSNPVFLAMGDRNIHLEHVLPQGYLQKIEWEHFHNDQNVEGWINSGGNLTLLSGAKNISASNSGFEKKLGAYSGKGFHENEAGITSFQITQRIVNDYYTNKNQNWDWLQIFRRWNWFCEQVEGILEINLADIKATAAELSA